MDIPMVAMMFVERKSWVIEANPSAYAPDEEAVDTWSDMLVVEEAKKDRPVMSEKNEAVSVIAHFRAYVKFAGSRGSPSSKSTCRRYGQNSTFSRDLAWGHARTYVYDFIQRVLRGVENHLLAPILDVLVDPLVRRLFSHGKTPVRGVSHPTARAGLLLDRGLLVHSCLGGRPRHV